MSVWKRKDPERGSGKKFLPRSAWKQKGGGSRPKTTQKKPFRLECRLMNYDEMYQHYGKYIILLYGKGEWVSAYKRFARLKDAKKSLSHHQQNHIKPFGEEVEYRIINSNLQSLNKITAKNVSDIIDKNISPKTGVCNQ